MRALTKIEKNNISPGPASYQFEKSGLKDAKNYMLNINI